MRNIWIDLTLVMLWGWFRSQCNICSLCGRTRDENQSLGICCANCIDSLNNTILSQTGLPFLIYTKKTQYIFYFCLAFESIMSTVWKPFCLWKFRLGQQRWWCHHCRWKMFNCGWSISLHREGWVSHSIAVALKDLFLQLTNLTNTF